MPPARDQRTRLVEIHRHCCLVLPALRQPAVHIADAFGVTFGVASSVALRAQLRLGLEGRARTFGGPSPDLSLWWPG